MMEATDLSQNDVGQRETYRDDVKDEIKSVADELARYRAAYWAQFYHINTRKEKMSFRDADYLFKLYIDIQDTPHMVVEKSVQCGLSELFIIQSHVEAGEYGWTVMYVLPKYELRNRFVNNRIYKLHKQAGHYAHLVLEAATTVHRTSLMHFGQGTLLYIGSNVEDEFIEVPIDSAFVDEKDRCNNQNLLLLPDRYSASPYAHHREISNPTVEGFGIDERYQESSMGVWEIQCDHCGKWFTPDFWRHVVRQTGSSTYEVVDPDYVPGERKDARLIHECGYPVNRLKPGRWRHEYPNRVWKGYRISKLFGKFRPLSELIDKHEKALGNSMKMQVFHNSDLGLAFSAKGAKVTRELLDGCKRGYRWPVGRVDPREVRVMGVDVGNELHVVMRERVRTPDGIRFRLVLARTLQGFTELGRLIREWKPRRVVVDAQPEAHKVSELKSDFGSVWSSRFQDSALEMSRSKQTRELRENRTAVLDSVYGGLESQYLWLPMQADGIDEGTYYAHMCASTRILEADEEQPEKSRYVWAHTRPDHYFLAEGYCMQAVQMLPRHDLFDFYEDEAETTKRRVARRRIKSGDTPEEKVEIHDMRNLTPEVFLGRIQDRNVKAAAVAPQVDDAEIWDVCQELYQSQGYVDVYIAAKQAGELEDDVVRVLKAHLFSESRIKGQYVR